LRMHYNYRPLRIVQGTLTEAKGSVRLTTALR